MTVSILPGDALAVLKTLPADSIDCCVTSPPYWGLRDYGVDGQIGLEATVAEHMDAMVAVFEEVRRVLKPTGSLWLNYGDCYAATPNGRSAADTKAAGGDDRTFRDKPFSTVGPIFGATSDVIKTNGAANGTGRRGGGNAPATGYLKPKDLCMLPNRLAIALQDAGWWVRSEIVWAKPNPMPDSSGAYRPSAGHEKIFLLTKSGDADVWRARDTGELSLSPDLTQCAPLVTKPDQVGPRWLRLGSWYDAEAVRMPSAAGQLGKVKMPDGWHTGSGGHGSHHRTGREKGKTIDKQRGHSRCHAGFNDRWDAMTKAEQGANGRYLRNYERDLSPLVPADLLAWEIAISGFSGAHFATFPPALVVPCIQAGCPIGGVVLDPFGGAGTTGLVADAMGRDAILIELNTEYAAMAAERLRAARVQVSGIPKVATCDLGPLFDHGHDEVAA